MLYEIYCLIYFFWIVNLSFIYSGILVKYIWKINILKKLFFEEVVDLKLILYYVNNYIMLSLVECIEIKK